MTVMYDRRESTKRTKCLVDTFAANYLFSSNEIRPYIFMVSQKNVTASLILRFLPRKSTFSFLLPFTVTGLNRQ